MLASVLAGAIAMFLSCVLKNMVASAGVICGTVFVDLFFTIPHRFRVLSQMRFLTPIQVLINGSMTDPRLVHIGEHFLGTYQTAAILYVVLICVFCMLTYQACLFDIRNIDLPRKVKYRPRYKRPELKVDRGCRIGRNYHDYEVYMEKHPDTAVVQMDSVIGSRGGKVLLTVYFVNVSLMLGFLRDANTSKSVIDIFDGLYEKLGGQDFRRLFPVILTDNGSEFSNPKCIENGPDGTGFQRTRIYYCNPSAPYQKAEIEVGHEFIRRILPKGKSFDELTQEDIDKMMNHINSYRRNKLNGKSPYEAFCFYYGKDLAQKLGCQEVPAKSIHLTPGLLKK